MRSIVTATVLVAALVVASAAGAKQSGGSAADCTLDGHTFVYWGADAEAAAIVECTTRHGWITVFGVVTRDGAVVASGEHRCRKATRCQKTFAPLDDPDGDQRWCVEVRGELQGGVALGPRTFCEEFTNL